MKKLIIALLFFIGIISFNTYSKTLKTYKINFCIKGGEVLTKDVELLLKYDKDTYTTILLEKENNYKFTDTMVEGEVEVEIYGIDKNIDVKYDKTININKDLDYTIEISNSEKKGINEAKDNAQNKTLQISLKNNLMNILTTIIITSIVVAIVSIIFGIIMLKNTKK